MEVERDSSKGDLPVVAVYLHGSFMGVECWYRAIVPVKRTKTKALKLLGKRKYNIFNPMDLPEIYPLLRVTPDDRGNKGSWDVIGDTIYCIGGFENNIEFMNPCKDLLKHRVNHTKPCSLWETESSTWIMPRLSPFFAALGTNKLCAVSGEWWYNKADRDRRMFDSDSDDDVYDHDVDYDDVDDVDAVDDSDSNSENDALKEKCGSIYNVETKCWSLLDADSAAFDIDSDAFDMYDISNSVAVMEKDGEEPIQIMFYDLKKGVIQVLDLATNGTSKPSEFPTDFGLLKGSVPRGLEDNGDFAMLKLVTHCVRAVIANGTFYWFTPAPMMRLYGYDTHTQTWLQSPSLKHDFPPLMPYDQEDPHYPILMYLRDGTGKLLVTVPECYGVVTMAFLTVDKQENSLNVSVDLVQPVRFDNEHFLPRDGKAVLLNNTG